MVLKFSARSFFFCVFTMLSSTYTFFTHSDLQDPVVLFSHGIADTYKQAFRYYNLGTFKKPFYSFNFPDATERFVRVNREFTVFAQEDEFNCLHDAYQHVATLHADQPCVLYGISRGASTICTFLAHHKPESVKAVILESPFAAIDDVVAFAAEKRGIFSAFARTIFSYIFPRYQWNGVKPIDVVADIPKDLPILLLCATTDKLVPYTSTMRLYQGLREAGCTNVYLVVLNHGEHAKLFLGNDWPLYKQVVHAFYKKCGLAHDPLLASRGDHLLCGAF